MKSTLTFFITLHCASASAEALFYFVKKHDKLEKILKAMQLQPIYGRDGFMNKTIALNQKYSKTKGNLIHPGDLILLPVKVDGSELKLSEMDQELQKREVPESSYQTVEAEKTLSISLPTEEIFANSEDSVKELLENNELPLTFVETPYVPMASTEVESEVSAIANIENEVIQSEVEPLGNYELPLTFVESSLDRAPASENETPEPVVQCEPTLAKLTPEQIIEAQRYKDKYSFKEEALYRFQLGIANSRIDSQDALSGVSSVILSDMIVKANGQVLFPTDEDHMIYLNLGVSFENYIQFRKNLNLLNRQLSVFNYGLGYEARVEKSLFFLGSLDFGQSIILKAVNSTNIELDKINVPSISAGFRGELYSGKWASVAAQADYIYRFKTSQTDVDTNVSSGYKLGLLVSRNVKNKPIRLKLEYLDIDQSTSIAKQKRKDAGVSLEFEY